MAGANSLEKTLVLGEIKGKGQEEKAVTETEDEFEQTLEDSEGQGSLACCSPWGCNKSKVT